MEPFLSVEERREWQACPHVLCLPHTLLSCGVVWPLLLPGWAPGIWSMDPEVWLAPPISEDRWWEDLRGQELRAGGEIPADLRPVPYGHYTVPSKPRELFPFKTLLSIVAI